MARRAWLHSLGRSPPIPLLSLGYFWRLPTFRTALLLPQHQHLSDVAVKPSLIFFDGQPVTHPVYLLRLLGHRQTSLSSFALAFKKRCLRNLRYLDAQVCFLKVLFKTCIDYVFDISTEINSDGRLKTLILFDWSVPC